MPGETSCEDGRLHLSSPGEFMRRAGLQPLCVQRGYGGGVGVAGLALAGLDYVDVHVLIF